MVSLDVIESCILMLQGFERAYPEDIFGPVTKAEREWLHKERPGLQDRIAGEMGRHLAKHMAMAANLLEQIAREREDTDADVAPT
jgi:hypothetical protein